MKKIIGTSEFFSLLRLAAHIDDYDGREISYSPQQWGAICNYALQQSVAAMIFEFLSVRANNMPPEIAGAFKASYEYAKGHYENNIFALSHFRMIASQENIRVMVLKGFGLASLYPNPELRECTDIDIYCFGDFDKVNGMMEHRGIKVDFEEGDLKHADFPFDNAMFENHKKFNYDINKANETVGRALEENFDESPVTDPLYPGLFFPNPSKNAILLMMHTISHLPWSGISIRQMLDWTLFVRKHKNDIDWAAQETLWMESGLSKIVGILQKISSDCLGAPRVFPRFTGLFDEKEYQLILSSIMNPQQQSSQTSNKFVKLVRKYRRFKHRKILYPVVYGEKFPDSFLKEFQFFR